MMSHLTYKINPFICLVCAAGLLALFAPFNLQAQKPNIQNKQPTITNSKPNKNPLCGEENLDKVMRIRMYLEQVKGFQDLEAKLRAAADIGSLIWQCDEIYSRNLFRDLFKSVKSKIESLEEARKSQKPNSKIYTDEAKDRMLLGKLKDLNHYVLAIIKLHDKELVQQLSKELTASDLANANYWAARAHLDSKNKAEAANAAIRALSNFTFANLELLYRIREVDVQLADSVYLQVLRNLSNNRLLTTREMAEAGTYVFVSSLPDDEHPNGMVFSYSAGGVLITALTEQHPAATPEAVSSYLNLVANFLIIPASDIKERNSRYALGRVLLPHVQQFAPALTVAFLRGLQTLGSDVPAVLQNEQTYTRFKSNKQDWSNLESNLEGIKKISDANTRDEFAIMLANSLYSNKDYQKALQAVEIITDLEKKRKLEAVTMLAIANQLLEQGQFSEAQNIAEDMPAGLERALFGFNLAKTLRKKEDAVGASQAIVQAVQDARRDRTSEVPILLLKIAKEVETTDTGLSSQLTTEAFKDFERFENWQNPKWQTEVEVRGRPIAFRFSGISGFTFAEAVAPFIKVQPDVLEQSIINLKSEKLRGEGLVLLAKALLSAKTAKN